MTTVSPTLGGVGGSSSKRTNANKMNHDDESNQEKKVVYVEDPAQPSRWFTVEYFIYYIIIVVGYYLCLSLMYNTSNGKITPTTSPTYPISSKSSKYNLGIKSNNGIVDGWFMGRKQDLSDTQYRIWRENFPLLSIGLSIFVGISSFIRSSFPFQWDS
ncbi:hypothetical protein PPL_10397 [Heterostelium album PN500]|uniref:Uncharacterized protein n=1 Tax=Heterostelium pallidum (strain ATCC 26659 / Pp 5 / PN500) TaxID=670386 RepID=D3BQZ4_HETP5|nr:hypothetical protein PPL_10397 [Heterostelium album PN500]EFA76180.1 hypothetical protein PPL_10397 [Heterostelium album PN500]|eukprot:XP_020428313.1 hypothetical protein PPL_10397 [Heterostelium album PN500]